MNFQPLKDFLDGYLSMLGIPGSDTSIYLDHKEIFRYSAGYDNILLKTPMRQDLIYNIYSCTKIATMVATAQLIERGEISLLDPVYAYIPEFRDVKVKVTDERGNVVGSRPATRPMLIKHLVSMTSGLNYNT
ncbi:MAG: beta-lactamase family protein, partial [Clostridia bacterium]|nr:beta-lactamase family protein [Clostridia bacterium]